MLIYIRHGHDRKRDYHHDEELTEAGKHASQSTAEQIINEHGVPDVIYYSPFLRTRATAKAMMKTVKRYKKQHGITKNTRLSVEPRLGRFFNRRERQEPDIHRNTIKRGALTHENKKLFKSRIEEHYEKINKSDEIIWNVTHSLVLLHVAKISDSQCPSHIDYLYYLVIQNFDKN